MIAASVLRLAIGVVLSVASASGLRSAAECRFDWAALGASLLMCAWSVRWMISAAALLRGGGERLQRTIQRVQAAGFAAAAVSFAMEFFLRQAAVPFGGWPLVVSVLFAVVAAVYLRDSRGSQTR